MKILLIVPRYNLTDKKNYNYTFPLGLAYIASVIQKAGYDIDCLNLNHLDGNVEDLVNIALSEKKYDVVCSGHIGIGHNAIKKIISACKLHKTSPKVITGGPLITSEPKLMFKSLNPDFGVIGEGEVTILELIKSLEMKKQVGDVNGIIYWNNKKEMVITPPRKGIDNIDSLPFPNFDLLGFSEYLDNQDSTGSPYSLFDFPRPLPILCSRGCPFQCTFCYHSLGTKYRSRSVDNIIKEIKYSINKYKINFLFIYDDLFAINKERLYDFCKKIKKVFKEVPWECKWCCQLSVQKVDDKLLTTLKEAGCGAISYGFESYSPIVLKSMKKPITPQQIDNAIKLTRKHRIITQGNFIFGDRAETKETARETLDYWKNNCDGQLQLFFIQPYPGTEIYEHCIRKGVIKDKLDFVENQMYNINWFNMTDSMTDKEILELKKEILKLRVTHSKYIVPLNVKKDKINYSFEVKCPYCNNNLIYRNCKIDNLLYYILNIRCRKCSMTFFVVSSLYKLGMKYYHKLEFFRKTYLSIRDSILKIQAKK